MADPLSDILSLLRPSNYLSAGFEAGGEWSIQFPHQGDGIKCGSILAGSCFIAVGDGSPIELGTGDFFLLPGGNSFIMASDLSLRPVPASDVFAPPKNGMRSLDGGRKYAAISSRFHLEGGHAPHLLRMLPAIILIRHSDRRATALRWIVEKMMQELKEETPGSMLTVRNLAHLMLIEALRTHLADGGLNGVGWLYALSDRQIGTAIRALHDAPEERWTLEKLAKLSGMSRSSFALRFRELVGETPMEYLARWRMMLAGERLTKPNETVSSVATSLGYQSDSAFSTAFKRVMSCSPRQFARMKAKSAVLPTA